MENGGEEVSDHSYLDNCELEIGVSEAKTFTPNSTPSYDLPSTSRRSFLQPQ